VGLARAGQDLGDARHAAPAAAEEYALWQAALSKFEHYRRDGWLRGWGITREEIGGADRRGRVALDGEPLTREALGAEIERVTGSAHIGSIVRGSWGSMLKPAAYEGKLCFGPSAGQKVTFTRPDTWLSVPATPHDPDAALREVTRRYLAANGPATREDYARWWGVTPAVAGRRIADLGDEVERSSVDGEAALDARRRGRGRRALRRGPARAGVRPVLSSARRSTPGAAPARRLARPRVPAQGWLSPVLLVDGRMEGVWRFERKGRRIAISIEPFRAQGTEVREAAEADAERIASFLGGEMRLNWAAAPT
jgi:hypothetical protein